MAVFTRVDPASVLELLRSYDPQAGLTRLEGISTGIENTNYFVTARVRGQSIEAVLTLFEGHDAEQVRHFIDILNWWGAQGFPVPAPLRNSAGHQLHRLAGKPALLLPRLPGSHHMSPSATDCATLGRLLGQMHRVAGQAPFQQPPTRDLNWMAHQRQRLQGLLPPASQERLDREIQRYRQALNDLQQCPHGLVHGDLFRDNVLFDGEETEVGGGETREGKRISGLIDFYHSSREVLLFDLAVVAIDWCRIPAEPPATFEPRLDPIRLEALLDAYRQERPWTARESGAWPAVLRLAALRFWLARLVSRFLPGYQQRAEAGNTIKDPTELERLLIHLDGIYP